MPHARHNQATTALWLLAVAALTGGGAAAEPVPIVDFARKPDFAQLQISSEGTRFAYVREVRGRRRLFVGSIAEPDRVHEITLAADDAREGRNRTEVARFTWVSDERLLVTTGWSGVQLYGVFAVNWNNQRRVPLSGNELPGRPQDIRFFATEPLYAFADDHASGSILMIDDRTKFGEPRLYPDVVRVNTLNGSVSAHVDNPGNVVGWGVDFAGAVRLGITSDAGDGTALQLGAVYREHADAPWRTLFEPAPLNDRIRPLDFEAASAHLLVATWSPTGRVAVHQFDPATGELGPELVSDPEYDILPDAYTPSFAGVRLADFVGSFEKGGVVGVRYCTDRIAIRWLDAEYAERQAAIDRLLPDTVNIVCGVTRHDREHLVLAFSDRDPGAYYLYAGATGELRLIGRRMAWIDPAVMAVMEPISFLARDGLRIPGYLTMPRGAEPRNLPLVVVPHGGPAAREVWGFDPFVQLLASRGYAVLQPNFRGSTGYGRDFLERGRREVGGRIQDDIEDATRWATAEGIADPARVAIVGVSFGGYSALFALGHNPELYRCGVSVAGVTDWMGIFQEGTNRRELALARAHWVDQIGDPAGDEARLRAASPLHFAERITRPVLLIHGRSDRHVPVRQTQELAAALKKHGHRPQVVLFPDEGHTFASETARERAFSRIVDFLDRHLASSRSDAKSIALP